MEEVEHLGAIALKRLKLKIECKIALLDQGPKNEDALYYAILCTVYADVVRMIDYELEKLNNEQ